MRCGVADLVKDSRSKTLLVFFGSWSLVCLLTTVVKLYCMIYVYRILRCTTTIKLDKRSLVKDSTSFYACSLSLCLLRTLCNCNVYESCYLSRRTPMIRVSCSFSEPPFVDNKLRKNCRVGVTDRSESPVLNGESFRVHGFLVNDSATQCI